MKGIRGWAIAAVALIAVGGGGYYVYLNHVQGQLRAALDGAIAQLPPGYSASYQTAQYSPAANHGVLTGVTLRKAEPQGFDVTIDEIELSRPALDFAAAWSRAASNLAAVTPETRLPLADGVTLKGVAFHVGALSGSVALFSVEGLRLYPWSVLQPGLPSWADAAAGLPQLQASKPDLATLQPLLRLAAAWSLAIGYDRYTQETVKVVAKLPMPPSNALTDIAYEVARVDATGAGQGVFGNGVAEGYNIHGSGGDAHLERVTMSGIDMRKPLMRLATQQTLAPEMLDGLAIQRIEYGAMTVTIPGQPALALTKISFANIAFSGAMPISGEFALDGLRVNRAQLPAPQADDAFAKLGLDTLTLSMGAKYRWDLAQKRLAMTDITLEATELGQLHLSFEISEIAPGIANAMQARLSRAALDYSDSSFVDRAIKLGATRANTDPAAYRQQLVGVIEAQAAVFADNPALQGMAKEMVAFLNAPQSLHIELAPPTPVPFTALLMAKAMPPATLAAMLGLTVTANR